MLDAVMMADDDSWPMRIGSRSSRSLDDFELWVSPYLAAMSLLASRLVGPANSDDVVQESLLRAWRRRETYRQERGTPEVWLLAIVADKCRRRWRRSKPRTFPLVETAFDPVYLNVDLERAVQALPPRQRLTIELYYFVGLTVAETAEVIGRSQGTVKGALHDARARLRQTLEDHD